MSSGNDFEVVIKRDAMIPMRDGVRLAVDIYHPIRNGQPPEQKLSVLLERTPYNKRSPMFSDRAVGFAKRGYVVVVEDCRGCCASEGEFYFLRDDPRDGLDTVEWIKHQPWSDGQVGTYGTSYMCWTQGGTATQGAHLTCMFPTMGGWNAYDIIHPGGAFEPRFVAWAFFESTINYNKDLKKNPYIDKVLNSTDFRDWLARWPLKKGHNPLAMMPNYEQWVFDFLAHADYDDYWKQPGFAWDEQLNKISDVPVYVCGAWYDPYIGVSLNTFTALKKTKKSDIRIIIGPWTHGTYTTQLSYAGDVDFGQEAALESFDELHLHWFDRWFKGIDNGIDRKPPIRLFVMGGGRGHKNHEGRLDHGGHWREEQEWPLDRTSYTNFYLHADGSLSPELPEETSAQTSYLSDPNNPVPTIGGNFCSLNWLKPPPPNTDPYLIPMAARMEFVTPVGGFDQCESPLFWGCEPPFMPLSSRPDVLVFQTEPLEKDTEVTGPIEVKLWISSSAVDTDFTAKLIDVYPPNEDYPAGYALNLTHRILRARYRNSVEHAEFLNPGEIYPITITLFPTSNLFKRGHRIRLDISSSNWPRFDVNPNTGEPIGFHRRTLVAENTIYHDKEHHSHVILPIIPS